jgi:5-methylcytosine-specific restriction endonuclease McrA
MTWHRRPSTLRTQQRQAILRQHHGICHVCGHEQATQIDHIINVASGGTDQPHNLAPIHGTPYGTHPCPTCGQACHYIKTQQEANKGIKRKQRTLEPHPNNPNATPHGGTPPPT